MGKPGPKCSVCQHRERAAIDLALARGVSAKALAKRSGLSKDALSRHSRAHLTAPMRAKLLAGPDLADIDLPRLRETESQSLLLHLVNLRHRLFYALDAAEEHGDGSLLQTVTSQLHRNLELTGKLLGDLGIGGTHITQNILVSPLYMELRGAIVGALRGHPEAAQSVSAALRRLEDKAADEVRAETRALAALPTKADERQAARREPVMIEATARPVTVPPPPVPPVPQC
jgi:hypothetical protein